MLVTFYKCPHCNKLFDDKNEYRKHVLEVMRDSADTINSFVPDLMELNVGVCINYSPFTDRPYVEVKTNVDKSN